jgi:phosphoribosylanthranilate isomerase
MADCRVKICGLTRREDAEGAVALGAGLLGAVLVPGSPRCVTAADAYGLFAGIDADRVIVVSDLNVQEAAAAARTVNASVIQLHGEEEPDGVGHLSAVGPWRVWKAVRVREPQDVERAVARYGEVVDGLVMDSWHPTLQGGTGASFSWHEVVAARDGIPPDLELAVAGGLTPENVREAISALRPDVVDVSSGVESAPGVKDLKLVRAFIDNATAMTVEEHP